MPWMWPVGWQLFMWTTAMHTMTAQATLVAGATLSFAAAFAGQDRRAGGEVVQFPPAKQPLARGGRGTGARVVELRPPQR